MNNRSNLSGRHYWHNRGIRLSHVVEACKELGLRPCYWPDFQQGFKIVQSQLIAKTINYDGSKSKRTY